MSGKQSQVFSPKAISKKKPGSAPGKKESAVIKPTARGGEKSKKDNEGSKKKKVDDIDDIFASAPAKPSKETSGESKKARGPDMEEVRAEAAKFRGSGPKGGREFVDGLPVYSEKELEEEMGETAWENFLDAAEPGLS